MRKPQTWYDKGLLEDEPFLSAFKARQIAGPPSRRMAKDNDASRNATIVQQIKEFSTVQAWLDLAFNDAKRRKVEVREPGMLNLFVQFYWTLSRDHKLAVNILEKERKRRGYDYVLDTLKLQGTSLISTADITKLKKEKGTPQIRNKIIDEKTKTQPQKREDISDKVGHASNDALRSQLVPRAKPIPPGLKFKKTAHVKKDVPDCPEQADESLSQSCPPSLDPTSGLSATRDPCQIELNSSTLPDPQNTAAVYDLHKTRKRRQTSPDARHLKHQKVNGSTLDTSQLYNVSNASVNTQLANNLTRLDIQAPNFGAGDNFKPRFQTSSHLPWKEDTSWPNSLMAAKPELTFNKTTLSLLPNAPMLNTYDPQGDLEAHLPGATRKTNLWSDLWTKGEHLSQNCPPARYGPSKTDTRTSALPPQLNLSVSPAIHAIAPNEVSVGRAEQAIMTSHRKTTRKTVQEETMVVPVKDKTTAVLAHNQSRGEKGMRTKKQAPVKVESPDIFMIQSETHPSTDLPPIYESLSHQPKQSERKRASSLEDRQHKRQKVDQEASVLITVQPDPVKKKRGRPPKVKPLQQEGSVSTIQLPPKNKTSRPPKPKSLAQAQSNAGKVIPLSGKNVEIKQKPSISTCIPFPPAQHHDGFSSQETMEDLSHHDHIPRSIKEELINRSERLLTQEHALVEGATLDCVTSAAMEDHPAGMFPTQKPPLDIKPPIWAQSRQEICETFDWFRSYQGGVYFAHNIVKGYLLSAFSSKRDRFEHDGRLIISHGGGKSESLHTRKGQTIAQPATDQLAQDKSVRALLDNYRNQRPLVLLIDNKYVLFPYDLGARDMAYVVLGFYTIAHAWAEYQPANNDTGRVVRYKFAFRWCDDQGSPWWLKDKETCGFDSTSPFPSTTFSLEPTAKRTPKKKSKDGQGAVLCNTTKVEEAVSSELKSSVCRLCHMSSPQVYTLSWVCLHPDCSRFWRDIKGNFLPDNLEYDFGFLKLMTSLPLPPDFGKLKPESPSRLSTNDIVTSYAFTRGFHCDSCGRLSCRFKWEKWECKSCGIYLQVSGSTHKAKDFWSNSLPTNYKDHVNSKISKIEKQPLRSFRHENGMGNVQSFILPDGRGKIHHIQPGTPLGRLEADEIFIEYQQQATAGELQFRRWPLRSHKCRGALLTNYFSQNSGVPYQYVGGAASTVPFENAPGAVMKARALIQKRIQQALEMRIEFNEILSAAYMERQKMAFHSDNEIGLGPVVAGLSLGSPALMHFRIHVKYDPLREQKGNLLSFVLRHGDILVMDGANVQEYYEHTVIPNNFRIAATARQITPGRA